MRILLVNNGTSHFSPLKDAFKNHEVTFVSFKDVKCGMDKGYDAVVLSGGSTYEVEENPHLFSHEINLIKNAKRPILGVCLGLQIIGYAYGCRVVKNKKRRSGTVKIQKTNDDPLFAGLGDAFFALERHHWSIKKNSNPHCLVALARSRDGIEALRVRNKPIWGTQFHPEGYQGNDGMKIITNFLQLVAQHKKLHDQQMSE